MKNRFGRTALAAAAALTLLAAGNSRAFASGEVQEQVREDVEAVWQSTDSLDEELDRIGAIEEKYVAEAQDAGTQMELSAASEWPYVLWDTELNDIWQRLTAELDEDAKASLLEEERRWITLKEKAAKLIVADYEGGSIYPMLFNEELSRITRNRVYELAAKLADATGSAYMMPVRDMYGAYIDTEGTTDIYSSLIIGTGMEGDAEATLSIYRLGTARGSIREEEGELVFYGWDDDLEAVIRCDWDGATFTITQAEDCPFAEGEVYTFPEAY